MTDPIAMKTHLSCLITAFAALVLTSCGSKPETVEATKAEPARDENIVTLTAENLQHMQLKVEPALYRVFEREPSRLVEPHLPEPPGTTEL